MPIFYVHQKQSYTQESQGGYVWSPQRSSSGRHNVGYDNMTLVHKGDYILHHRDKQLVAIGRALSDYYSANKPTNLGGGWSNQGYKVDVEYHEFDVPLNVMNYCQQLRSTSNDRKGNAFTIDGEPTQHYMCVLTDEQSVFLLNHILSRQNKASLLRVLKNALLVVQEDTDDDVGNQIVNSIIDSGGPTQPHSRSGVPKPVETTLSSTNRIVAKRDETVAANALYIANHTCEVNPSHQTFIRKNASIPYMESHHLIPISRFRDFNYSLDVEANIVSLCPTCHQLLHHGKMADKEPILRQLLQNRLADLRQCGINITIETLKSYYR